MTAQGALRGWETGRAVRASPVLLSLLLLQLSKKPLHTALSNPSTSPMESPTLSHPLSGDRSLALEPSSVLVELILRVWNLNSTHSERRFCFSGE